MSAARKVFEVIVEKVYEIEADSLEEAEDFAKNGGDLSGYIVDSSVVSVHEVHP